MGEKFSAQIGSQHHPSCPSRHRRIGTAVFTKLILDSPLTTRADDRSEDGTSAEDVKLVLCEADVLFTVDAIDPFIVLYTEGEVEIDELSVSINEKSFFATGRSFRSSSTSIAATS